MDSPMEKDKLGYKIMDQFCDDYSLDINLLSNINGRSKRHTNKTSCNLWTAGRKMYLLFLVAWLSQGCCMFHIPVSAENDTLEAARSRSLEGSSPDSSLMLDSVEPRQYFKIHVAPKKTLKPKNAHNLRRAINNQDQQQTSPTSNNKQKISNAKLKKLLNQSMLMKSMNSSSSFNLNQDSSAFNGGANGSGITGAKPTFKFVFIQRATAAPSLGGTTKSHQKSSSTSVPPQASLAASVSKQLANSLLNSAVNLVDNLQASSKPSLSVLASQLNLTLRNSTTTTIPTAAAAASTLLDTQSASETASKTSWSTTTNDQTSSGSDIKRIQSDKRKQSLGSSLGTKKKQSGSKIYNLPVKFVNNGQPNHVVFTTLKHHFATIKKIQAVAASLAVDQNKVGSAKRKKQEMTKLKGNSRFIYLPLKYLSNARPNKIIISKATHKSTANN